MPHTTERLTGEEPQALAIRSYLLSGNVSKLSGTTVSLQQGGGGPKDKYRLEATCHMHSLLGSTESSYCILGTWMQNLGCCDDVCLWEEIAMAVVGNLKSSDPAHPAKPSG